MFILIRTDDTDGIQVDLLGTYNTLSDAREVMVDDWKRVADECGTPDDYESVSEFDAACWTEMDGGTYWHIFDSDNC